MSRPCSDRAGDLAALALGALTPEQSLAVQAHVDGCQACASVLLEHRAVVDVLDQADAGRLGREPHAPVGLDRRVIRAVAREQALGRRRTWTVRGLLAAAAMVIVAGVAGALLLATREAPGEVVVVALSDAASAETVPGGTATVEARPWGTSIGLDLEASESGKQYRVWLATADGARTPAGTFTGQSHPLTVSLASALQTDLATTLGISTDSADPLVEVALPDPS